MTSAFTRESYQGCLDCGDSGKCVHQRPARELFFRGTRLGYTACRTFMFVYGRCPTCRGELVSTDDVETWAGAEGFDWPETVRSVPRGCAVVAGIIVEADAMAGEFEVG